jgi:hypothetical protein
MLIPGQSTEEMANMKSGKKKTPMDYQGAIAVGLPGKFVKKYMTTEEEIEVTKQHPKCGSITIQAMRTLRFVVVFEANTMFPRKGDAPAPANNLAKQKIMESLDECEEALRSPLARFDGLFEAQQKQDNQSVADIMEEGNSSSSDAVSETQQPRPPSSKSSTRPMVAAHRIESIPPHPQHPLPRHRPSTTRFQEI